MASRCLCSRLLSRSACSRCSLCSRFPCCLLSRCLSRSACSLRSWRCSGVSCCLLRRSFSPLPCNLSSCCSGLESLHGCVVGCSQNSHAISNTLVSKIRRACAQAMRTDVYVPSTVSRRRDKKFAHGSHSIIWPLSGIISGIISTF